MFQHALLFQYVPQSFLVLGHPKKDPCIHYLLVWLSNHLSPPNCRRMFHKTLHLWIQNLLGTNIQDHITFGSLFIAHKNTFSSSWIKLASVMFKSGSKAKTSENFYIRNIKYAVMKQFIWKNILDVRRRQTVN